MSTSRKTEEADRSGGGPVSSHQGGSHGHATRHAEEPRPGESTSTSRSQVSGGGGEADRHHSSDPRRK
ncbi:hypothetical protein [Roseomonas gilardii]|uniref:hypothetical protein n=1 Tax=Roseomonas gilardii TaxID=257708 RepID=UPI00119E2A89|nr:hypothetical protein [Roseomonas gilardii]